MRLSNSEKMRHADALAIHERKIPSTALMTRAAESLVRASLPYLTADKCAVIFCGSGNNGGDGAAAAYMLHKRGFEVYAYLVGSRDKMTDDTREMERRLHEYGGGLISFDESVSIAPNCGVIIDAMFGIGLNSPLRGNALVAAELINSSAVPVVAADIPSGVVADTGEVLGEAVRADITVTFSMAKPGAFVEPGCVYCGEVQVCDIGIPEDILSEACIDVTVIKEDELRLPKRNALSHKYTYGRLLILGGSVGYTGAVSMCTKAAVRSGAGVVFTGVPSAIYDITAVKNDEAVVFPLPCDGTGRFSQAAVPDVIERLKTATACVLGPGLARSGELTRLVDRLICVSHVPMVLDADALYAVGQNPEMLRRAKAPMILTPHEGEFKALGAILTTDRLSDARAFAIKHDCTLILKGHHSIAAFPDGETVICPYGNPGMAKGGSGDVLAGILGAMLCQMPQKQAVQTALLIHALCGDKCAEEFGAYSMTPSDMINCICKVTKHLTAR